MTQPEHLWVWDEDRWRVCRLVRYARDGRRVVVRFCRDGGRWTGLRHIDLARTRPVGGGG